jgi:hypothetical protein
MTTETFNVKTWADGFGVWHASVPLSGSASRDAMRARRQIRAELDARGVSEHYRLRVTRERVTNHGTAVYREV